MRDRTPTRALENGALRYGVYAEDGSLLRGTRDGKELCLVYCGGARFLAVKPDAPDTVVCHLEFLIRAGRAWGVRVGTRVFERD